MHPLDIIYWSCIALGGMYTLITMLMGGLSHVAGHAGEIGHALHLPRISDHGHAGHIGPAGQNGSAGHAGHTANGGHHAPVQSGHDGAHGHGEIAPSGRSGSAGTHLDVHLHPEHGEGGGFSVLQYLNPMSVAGFLLGFGGAGVAARTVGVPVDASLLYAGAGGAGIYTGAYLILSKLFVNAQASSHNRRENLIGLRANVTAPIAGSQPGMVSYTVAGSRQSLPAVTEDEDPIPVGAVVRIRRVEGNRAQVMRID